MKRLVRHSLIAGHGALAMLALATIHVTLPATPKPQWHTAGQQALSITQPPRRLPAARRAERALID